MTSREIQIFFDTFLNLIVKELEDFNGFNSLSTQRKMGDFTSYKNEKRCNR